MPATLNSDDIDLIFNTVVEGENQIDGGGVTGATDVTLAQAIRLILGYCAGNGTNLNTDSGQAIVKSLDGSRNRIVAQLVNGNRSITSRDAT